LAMDVQERDEPILDESSLIVSALAPAPTPAPANT
jgi:hypothetical protein